MEQPNRVTAILLLIAAAWSLLLFIAAFVMDVPVRSAAHDLVRSASGGYTQTPVATQTYFQKYGVAELVLTGLGFVFVIAVAATLRRRAAQGGQGAGRSAWNIAMACVILGIIGSVTVAPYLLAVGVLLVLACGTVPRGGASAATRLRPSWPRRRPPSEDPAGATAPCPPASHRSWGTPPTAPELPGLYRRSPQCSSASPDRPSVRGPTTR